MKISQLNESTYFVAPTRGNSTKKMRVEANSPEEALKLAPRAYYQATGSNTIIGTQTKATESAWDIFERDPTGYFRKIASNKVIRPEEEMPQGRYSYEKYRREI